MTGLSRLTTTKSVWVAISVEVGLCWTQGEEPGCPASDPAASLTDHSFEWILTVDWPETTVMEYAAVGIDGRCWTKLFYVYVT